MSGQIFEVELPGGRIVEVEGAPDADAARQRVRNFLEEEQRARPIDRFGESFVSGARTTGGGVPGAVEAGAAALGVEGARDMFTRFRQAVEGPADRDETTRQPELRDLISSRVLEALRAYAGQGFGSMAAIGAGALAGAGIGGVVSGGAGAAPGAIAGGLTTARMAGISELYQGLTEEGVDSQLAGQIAVPVGYLIGRIETRYLDDFLQRQLRGRVDPSVISRVANRLVGGRAGGIRGSTVGAAISEGGGEALRQATIAGVTGDPNLLERGERVLEEIVVGAIPGSAMGAANRIRGRAGESPQEGAAPPATGQPADTTAAPTPDLTGTYDIPPPPEPVTNVEEALRVIEANPAYRYNLSENLSDAAAVNLANDIQEAQHAQEVTAVRRSIVEDFFGNRDVAITPATIDAEGNPTAESRDYTRSARTLFTNILNARAEGQLEGNRFTANELLDIAFAPFGLSAQDASREDRAVAREVLDGLAQQRLLTRRQVGKGSAVYSLAPRPLPEAGREPGRPGEAPQTQEDIAAQQISAALDTWRNNPTQANLQAVNRLAADSPLLTQATSDYVTAYTTRATLAYERDNLINEINRQNNTQGAPNPQTVEQLQAVEDQVVELSTILGRIEDTLAGRAAGTLRASQPEWNSGAQYEPIEAPEFSAQTGLKEDPNFKNWRNVYNAWLQQPTNDLISAAGIRVRDREFIARLIQERPQEAIALVRDLAATRPPDSVLTASNIQAAGQTLGINIPAQEAVQLYNVARMSGVINRLGRIVPQETQPTGFAEQTALPRERSQLERDVGRQGAEETFQRVVGSQGRLEIRDRLLLEDLDAETRQAAAEQGITDIDGVAIGDLAILSLADPNVDMVGLAMHEGFHVADRIGLITPNERALLNASRDKILEVIKNTLSPTAYEAAQSNLAELRAYGANARVVQKADFGSLINQIFDKVGQFVERIGNFLRGRGYNDWRSIYDKFYAGEMATRQADPQWRNAEPEAFFHAAQRTTPEFKKWFGNSKVVDRNGNPRIVYHAATRPGFERFDTQRGIFSLGSHFGTTGQANSIARDTQIYSPDNPVAVYPVYLKLENPLRMEDQGVWHADDIIRRLVQDGVAPDNAESRAAIRAASTENAAAVRVAQQYIQKLGYDGIVYRNEFEDGGGDSYIAFNPQQIKSAVGNVGNFNPRSPNVNFAVAGVFNQPATQATRRNTEDLIASPMRWFSSPIMSIPKYIPAMRGVADTVQQLYTRAQEMTVQVDTLIEDAYRLQPQSVAKITRVWETASRRRQAPNLTGLNQKERTALQGMMASVQRGLDFFIESAAIQYFLPSKNKTAAQNTRLEAFWQRHAGKHLWEIPRPELLSASREGYAEMQKYERIRNPYYMPQVGRGTHFVAAYKKGPGGKRGQLVGMVAYNPLNPIQKLRGFANPEAAAINQLSGEFNPATHVIMQRGQQFTNDAEAANIRDTGDFVAQYMDRLRQAGSNNTAVTRIIDEMTSQIDKATMERIFRPNKDILRAVTPENESSYILDVMPQYLLSMAKVQARRYTQEQYKDETAALSPNDKAYWDELRNYATTPTEAFGGLRATAFFYYLGGAIDTALINLTQNIHTAAYLLRDGGMRGQGIFLKTMSELFQGLEVSKFGGASGSVLMDYINKLPADEKAAALKAIEQGIFTPVFTNESRSQFTVDGLRRLGAKNPQKLQRGLTTISHYAGILMARVEEFNRAAAFLASYRLAKQQPDVIATANYVDNTNYQNAYSYAVGKVIDTQFLTTKEDRAYMQRFHPAAEVATQFLSYPFKTIEQYARSLGQLYVGLKDSDPILAKAGAVSLLGMVGPLIMLGGVFALPFADSLKEWSEELIKLIWGTPRNFDVELREALGAGAFAEAVVRGIPHQQGWASLSRRIALDPIPANDIMNMSLATVTGPAGSLILETPQNAYAYYQNGDYWQLAASLLPRAVGNVVRGMQLHFDEEQYTRRGNRVITPQDVERASSGTPPSVRQALGFPPPEFANLREVVGAAEELNQATRSRSERINKELSRILVNLFEAQRAGNSERVAQYNREYGERFREVILEESERPLHVRINPQHSAIVRRAMRDFYGIASEEALQRSGRSGSREEAIRQRAIILGGQD